MATKKSFWTTLPGIITGIAAIITAITGLIVALNGTGLFNKSTAANKEVPIETKTVDTKPTGSLTTNQQEPPRPVEKLKPVFSMTKVKIEDHEYTITSASLEAITPETNSLTVDIKYKNNNNYSPAPFYNEGFRLAIDGALTAPTGDLSKLVERHAEQVGTVTFEVPNTAKELVFHILDGKDVAVPVKLVAE